MNAPTFPSHLRVASDSLKSPKAIEESVATAAESTVSTVSAAIHTDDRLGAILIRRRKLSPEAVERVLAAQKTLRPRTTTAAKTIDRFGVLAKQMNLCDEEDINAALNDQRQMDRAVVGASPVAHSVVCAYTADGEFAGQIASIRNYLQFNWHQKSRDRIMQPTALAVMSPCTGDGRSVMTANLGAAFAQAGLRTLVIDADLRKPNQSQLLGFDKDTPGLTSMSKGDATLNDVIVKVNGMRNLHLVPAGPRISNPQDLFTRDGFSELLSTCHKSYDVVLIDTPASEKFPESVIIGRVAGAVLLVARRGVTQAEKFEQMQIKAQQCGLNSLGSVLLQ